jgi:hypothetical protein
LKEFWEIEVMREGAKGFIFALRKEDGCLILIILFFLKKPLGAALSQKIELRPCWRSVGILIVRKTNFGRFGFMLRHQVDEFHQNDESLLFVCGHSLNKLQGVERTDRPGELPL